MEYNDDVELEANTFAVLLLIPEFLLIPELKKGLDLSSDDDMKALCKKFGVSSTAMTYRLSLLKNKYPKGAKY